MRVFAGLLTRITQGGKVFQTKSFGKPKDNVQNLTPYGFFCYPPKNSKVVLIPDATESFYGIAYKNDVVPILKEGEVAIGNFTIGATIKFDKEGNIDITAPSGKNITLNGNQVNLAPTVVNSGANKVLTDATVIHDSTGNPCTIISGASDDLKTT